MKLLSDETLLDAYCKAVKLQLENDFIALLEDEIAKRALLVPPQYN
jgi:hypothetical protein